MNVETKPARGVWVVQAGPPEELRHTTGPYEASLEKMKEEFPRLVGDLSAILASLRPDPAAGYALDEVVFEATFDSVLGFALVGHRGGRGNISLKFSRVPPPAA